MQAPTSKADLRLCSLYPFLSQNLHCCCNNIIYSNNSIYIYIHTVHPALESAHSRLLINQPDITQWNTLSPTWFIWHVSSVKVSQCFQPTKTLLQSHWFVCVSDIFKLPSERSFHYKQQCSGSLMALLQRAHLESCHIWQTAHKPLVKALN